MLAVVAAIAVAVPMPRHNPQAEPAYRLSVEIDGVVVPLVDGERGEVTIGDRKLPIRATVLPTRILDAKGVRFEFPRAMAFEAELSNHYDHWSLDGGDCTILLDRFSGIDAPSPGDMLDSIAGHTAGGVKDQQPTEWTLGRLSAKGVVGTLTIAGTGIQNTVLRFEAAGATYLLVVQDTLDDQGQPTEESKRVRRILEQTFEVQLEKR